MIDQNKNKIIFLDKASTSIVYPSFYNYLSSCLKNGYANPSSVHILGQKTRALIDKARLTISRILKCKTYNLIFTSSATESNNLVINNDNYIFYVSVENIHSSIFEVL